MNCSLFKLGFRPFFLCASGYGLLAILLWGLSYTGELQLPVIFSSPMLWHGHEMVYGYAVAVIAGFLLTAVKNWTGEQTLHGRPLLLLVLVWLVARIFAVMPNDALLIWQAAFDNLFLLLLSISLALPIFKTKSWKQLALVTKVLLIMASNIVFYLGAAGIVEDGERLGLYSGVYLILALILTLARRLMPFFIESGIKQPVKIKNNAWIDRSSLLLFLLFWIADLVTPDNAVVAILAALLFVLHAVRLSGWYNPGIWNQPLLWVLFAAYGFMIGGFLLKALVWFAGVPASLALHTFTYGGIGLMTLGMMARVSLGHTGRDVYRPSKTHAWMFLFLASGALIRVVLPLIDAAHYMLWIQWSYLHWVIAFALFVFIYAPKLVAARVDGKPG